MAISVLMNYCKNPLNGCSGWKDLNNKDVWNCTKGLNGNKGWYSRNVKNNRNNSITGMMEITEIAKMMTMTEVAKIIEIERNSRKAWNDPKREAP